MRRWKRKLPFPTSWALLALLAACHSPREVPILLWHSVGEGAAHDVQDVTPQEFEAELALIESFGATPITLGQLFDARAAKGTLPARPVVLTFDDNRRCLYDQVLPLLVKRHLIAELFVVTDYLGEDEAHRRSVTQDDGPHPLMTTSEVRAMQASGAFVIEAHTLSHRSLVNLSEAEQRREIVESRAVLQRRFHAPVDFFAYPYGDSTRLTRSLTEEAGYRGAVAVTQGSGGPYSLHRLNVWRGDLELVRRFLQLQLGAPDAGGPCESTDWTAR